jgi:hypothetical protein
MLANTAANNVLAFPTKNTNVPVVKKPKAVDQKKLLEKANNMKIEFYNEMADDIINSIVRRIAALDLAEMSNVESEDERLNEMDIIILRESLVSIMCRLTAVDHPLHKILNQIIDITEVETDEGPLYSYTLKKPTK